MRLVRNGLENRSARQWSPLPWIRDTYLPCQICKPRMAIFWRPFQIPLDFLAKTELNGKKITQETTNRKDTIHEAGYYHGSMVMKR